MLHVKVLFLWLFASSVFLWIGNFLCFFYFWYAIADFDYALVLSQIPDNTFAWTCWRENMLNLVVPWYTLYVIQWLGNHKERKTWIIEMMIFVRAVEWSIVSLGDPSIRPNSNDGFGRDFTGVLAPGVIGVVGLFRSQMKISDEPAPLASRFDWNGFMSSAATTPVCLSSLW